MVHEKREEVEKNPSSFLQDIRPDLLNFSSLFQSTQDSEKVRNFLYQEESKVEVILDVISENYSNIC